MERSRSAPKLGCIEEIYEEDDNLSSVEEEESPCHLRISERRNSSFEVEDDSPLIDLIPDTNSKHFVEEDPEFATASLVTCGEDSQINANESILKEDTDPLGIYSLSNSNVANQTWEQFDESSKGSEVCPTLVSDKIKLSVDSPTEALNNTYSCKILISDELESNSYVLNPSKFNNKENSDKSNNFSNIIFLSNHDQSGTVSHSKNSSICDSLSFLNDDQCLVESSSWKDNETTILIDDTNLSISADNLSLSSSPSQSPINLKSNKNFNDPNKCRVVVTANEAENVSGYSSSNGLSDVQFENHSRLHGFKKFAMTQCDEDDIGNLSTPFEHTSLVEIDTNYFNSNSIEPTSIDFIPNCGMENMNKSHESSGIYWSNRSREQDNSSEESGYAEEKEFQLAKTNGL